LSTGSETTFVGSSEKCETGEDYKISGGSTALKKYSRAQINAMRLALASARAKGLSDDSAKTRAIIYKSLNK